MKGFCSDPVTPTRNNGFGRSKNSNSQYSDEVNYKKQQKSSNIMSSNDGWKEVTGPLGQSHWKRWIGILVISVIILSAIGAYALSSNMGVVHAAGTTVTTTVTSYITSISSKIITQNNYVTETQTQTNDVTNTEIITSTEYLTSTSVITTTESPLPINVYVAFTNLSNTMDYSINWGTYTISSQVSENTNVSLFNVYAGETIDISLSAGASSDFCTSYGWGFMSLIMNSTVAAENSGQIGYCSSLSINYTV